MPDRSHVLAVCFLAACSSAGPARPPSPASPSPSPSPSPPRASTASTSTAGRSVVTTRPRAGFLEIDVRYNDVAFVLRLAGTKVETEPTNDHVWVVNGQPVRLMVNTSTSGGSLPDDRFLEAHARSHLSQIATPDLLPDDTKLLLVRGKAGEYFMTYSIPLPPHIASARFDRLGFATRRVGTDLVVLLESPMPPKSTGELIKLLQTLETLEVRKP